MSQAVLCKLGCKVSAFVADGSSVLAEELCSYCIANLLVKYAKAAAVVAMPAKRKASL